MRTDKQTEVLRLMIRQRHLQALINELNEELKEVNRRLLSGNSSKKPRLDGKFFIEIVRPILATAGESGLQAKDLYRHITEQGLEVDYDNLRLFLSRAARRHQIRQITRVRRPNSWALELPAKPVTETSIREEVRL